MNPFGDRDPFVLWNMPDGDRSHAAVTAVWADPNATSYSLFCERRKTPGEDSSGCIPPELRLEPLTGAGKGQGIELKDLNRDGGALGCAVANPGFEFACGDRRPWLQLHIADWQFAGIGVRLADDSGKGDGGMLEQDVFYGGRI